MKRATVTFSDEIAQAMDDYLSAQEAPPALTTLVQAAMREYLSERGFLQPYKPLKIRPAKHGSGSKDGSIKHDLYLAGIKE